MHKNGKPMISIPPKREINKSLRRTPKKNDEFNKIEQEIKLKKNITGTLTTGQVPKSQSTSAKKWFTTKPTTTKQLKEKCPLSVSLRVNNDKRLPLRKIRPISVVDPTNVNLRKRGQPSTSSKHLTNEQQSENLSRTSSVTNLNDVKRNQLFSGATTTKRKTTINEQQQQQQQQSEELELLNKQLIEITNDNRNLTIKLNDYKQELKILQNEIDKFKLIQEQSNLKMEQMNDENLLLRNRLRDVAHSPLSDNEKQQLLLYDVQQQQQHYHLNNARHSSAPASIATNLLDDGGGDVTACPTPEWDKHSSSNVSEVSVACLQDKINQMQETHYSTNEELQATLQELTDLQRQLSDLHQENERLLEEKNLMFESLCRQTERLNDTRNEVESLKQLLYKNDNNQYETIIAVEREQKLVDLLKSAQEEREVLLIKQEQLDSDLKNSKSTNLIHDNEIQQLNERIKQLESILDAKHAEHKQLDQELAIAKDYSSSRQIEINRLKDLLENARTKINELEQDRALGDKSELDELLDNARKEKDSLESEITNLKEQLALTKNDNNKLKEQLSIIQEECKVIRNNAKTTQSDLEYKCEKYLLDKQQLNEQIQQFQEIINELQMQSQIQLDDKRQLSTVLSETQRNLNEAERKICSLENELGDIKKLRHEENEEWEKFQNDLLTSVRVANDFKTEAQQNLQKMIMENKTQRERVKQLEAQIDKLKVSNPEQPTRPTSFPTVDDLQIRRPKLVLSRQNSRQSVKSLIESIENATKSIKCSPNSNSSDLLSRSNSNSSLNSLQSISNVGTPNSPLLRTTPDWTSDLTHQKQPLKEQQPNRLNTKDYLAKSDLIKTKSEEFKAEFARRNSYSDLTSSERNNKEDPLNSLVKNGGSKRNALLKWCQNKTVGYRNIDITNFSSSWNDGLALCALLHTYLPDRIPYDSLTQQEKRRNFSLAFTAAESVGIPTTLNINDMIQLERPDWQQVMSYVTAIYKHFET